jgi:hypothetical protein
MSDSLAVDPITSGAPAAKFPEIGDIVRITVSSVEKRQSTEFGTDAPLFHPDGTPVYERVISGIGEEGEELRIFAKKQMLSVVTQAVRDAGLSDWGSMVGGTLAVKFDSEKASATKGYAPQKIYTSKFTPAKPQAVTVDDL